MRTRRTWRRAADGNGSWRKRDWPASPGRRSSVVERAHARKDPPGVLAGSSGNPWRQRSRHSLLRPPTPGAQPRQWRHPLGIEGRSHSRTLGTHGHRSSREIYSGRWRDLAFRTQRYHLDGPPARLATAPVVQQLCRLVRSRPRIYVARRDS